MRRTEAQVSPMRGGAAVPCAQSGAPAVRYMSHDVHSATQHTATTPHAASASPSTASVPSADPASGPTLVLLDGHALFHRSFHAFPDEMSTSAGLPVNAVFGFAR